MNEKGNQFYRITQKNCRNHGNFWHDVLFESYVFKHIYQLILAYVVKCWNDRKSRPSIYEQTFREPQHSRLHVVTSLRKHGIGPKESIVFRND